MTLSTQIITWQIDYGRHDLPWQIDRTPYRVWISEIMLQQTQVKTVIGYFDRFMKYCPNVYDLANIDNDQLMRLWQGLGYYSRARNLKKSAQMIVSQYNGELPTSIDSLLTLPGVGPSTAAAILALAHNQAEAILDGNVKRVLCRYHGIDADPKEKDTLKTLWVYAKQHGKNASPRIYTQGIMDLGATICKPKNPKCMLCPIAKDCIAKQQNIQNIIPKKSQKKPKKKVDLFVLIEVMDGSISLFLRPSSGIWGQLYTPALYDQKETLLSQHPTAVQLISYKHLLTHIELSIHPFVTKVKSLSGEKSTLMQNIQYPIPKGIEPAIKQTLKYALHAPLDKHNIIQNNKE